MYEIPLFVCLFVCLFVWSVISFSLDLCNSGLFSIISDEKISSLVVFSSARKAKGFVFYFLLDGCFKFHSNKYSHLMVPGILKIVFKIFFSFLFVNTISWQCPVDNYCDILQLHKVLMFSCSVCICPRFTSRLPMKDARHPRLLFSSKYLNLSSVKTTSFKTLYFEPVFNVQLVVR